MFHYTFPLCSWPCAPPAKPKPCPLSAPTIFLDNQHRTAIGMETTWASQSNTQNEQSLHPLVAMLCIQLTLSSPGIRVIRALCPRDSQTSLCPFTVIWPLGTSPSHRRPTYLGSFTCSWGLATCSLGLFIIPALRSQGLAFVDLTQSQEMIRVISGHLCSWHEVWHQRAQLGWAHL